MEKSAEYINSTPPLKEIMSTKIDFPALYKNIRTRIYTLDYPPGEALREEELAKEFGVSRTPIRQVLQTLEYEGLVSSRPGVGSVVTTVDLRALKEVYAFRLKLVELAGELSSPRISETTIENLEALLKEIHDMRENYDPKGLALLYLRFHEEMMVLITNRPLARISDQLFHQTARVWLQILPELNWEDEVEAFFEEVRDVIKALKAKDILAFASVRRNHMALLLVRINRYLSSADNGNPGGNDY
jgi:DNA-binding GntR family transcriptional regulator